MNRSESLQLTRGLELPHDLLAYASGLVRILRPVVQPFVLAVLDAQAEGGVGRCVAAQFVRHHHTRAAVALEQLAHQPLGCRRIAPALDQDVEYGAMLIHGPPQPVRHTPNRHDHLVEVPFVAAGLRRRANTRAMARPNFVAQHRVVLSVSSIPSAASISSIMRRLSGNR